MKTSPSALLVLAAALCLDHALSSAADHPLPEGSNRPQDIIIDFPQPFPVGEKQISTSVVLRTVEFKYAPAPAPAVVNLAPGSGLKLSLPFDDSVVQSVRWIKDGKVLPAAGKTYEVASMTPEQSGNYSANLTKTDFTGVAFEQVMVRVETPARQRLLNLSMRATIGPANRFVIGGFVVSPSAGKLVENKLILIRAIGPSLAAYGVGDPLADPEVHLFRQDGSEVSPPIVIAIYPGPFDGIPAKVGAFPIPAGTKDVSTVFFVSAGVYSARVLSAGGGSGTVLLEIYEVPE
ncbi:MAG: hypothetical protein JWM88_3254 [Verrucomicrobia bacterium]|nr:hypothetical protein [Verrucomicrobiota bacterium]